MPTFFLTPPSLLRAAQAVLESRQRVRGRVLLTVTAVHTALLLGLRTEIFAEVVSLPVQAATGGAVSHLILANALMAVVLIGGLAMAWGGQRLQDVGLRTGWPGGWQWLNAVLVTYLLWACTQLVLAGVALWDGDPVLFNEDLFRFAHPVAPAVGASVAAFLSSAMMEELVYRGFLLPQIYLLLRHRGWRAGPSLVGALLASQAFFGLNHMPVARASGLEGAALGLYVLQVAAVGSVFAVLYLQTGNLLIAVGLHALINEPSPIYLTDAAPRFVTLVVVLALMLVWPWTARRLNHVFQGDRLRALSRLRRVYTTGRRPARDETPPSSPPPSSSSSPD